jgi:DMSO/TMAO reductase YedYZ molybdopterin-dependent catalytic subunit
MPRSEKTGRRGPSRRNLLRGAAAAAGTLALGGCDALSSAPWFRNVLFSAEHLTERVQRLLLGASALAREYPEADISPAFRANGTTAPDDPAYVAMAANGFGDFRLKLDGLVESPAEYSLADLRAMPARTQITRHDCVEGWSCIGKWKGVPLGRLLDRAGLRPEARFIVFHCADALEKSSDGSGQYYESIAVADAYHPQTILAYEMNDAALPIAHGAPLRLRVERQLGYKMAKYVMRVEAVESFAGLHGGKGGFWEDRGYEWYAGI